MKQFILSLIISAIVGIGVGYGAVKLLKHYKSDSVPISVPIAPKVSNKEKLIYLNGATDVLDCVIENIDNDVKSDRTKLTMECFKTKTNKFLMEGPKESTLEFESEDETTL